MNDLRLILVSPEPALCAEFREQFKELTNVEVVDGYFESLPEFDCLVSPANSFGIMDGGMDAAITRFFGDGLQQALAYRNFLSPPTQLTPSFARERQWQIGRGGDLGAALPKSQSG